MLHRQRVADARAKLDAHKTERTRQKRESAAAAQAASAAVASNGGGEGHLAATVRVCAFLYFDREVSVVQRYCTFNTHAFHSCWQGMERTTREIVLHSPYTQLLA
jgi:uncharacterized membrane protein